MHVTTLALRNFRNFQQLDLKLHPGTTLIYGPNASGKTSLLEALFYLATTRSPRAGNDREMIHWNAQAEAGAPPFARLAADVQRSNDSLHLEVIVQLKNIADPAAPTQLTHTGATQKRIRFNQRTVRSIDIIGQLRVVLFTPADLMLVEGSPSERRRYLDITLSQLDPRYVRTLSHYNKLLQQRNSLLRAWREQRRPIRAIDQELGYWDKEIATSAGYILAERVRAVADLNGLVGTLFQNISGGTEPLTIHYQSSCDITSMVNADEIEQQIINHFQRTRQEELGRGLTLIGPHRDDLLFTVGGINLGIYGSRGQQRSVALALKLGEAALMHQRSGETPVLLLDDILSELDIQRRNHVLEVIEYPGQQTLLSATDLGGFDAAFLQRMHSLRVENGKIYGGG